MRSVCGFKDLYWPGKRRRELLVKLFVTDKIEPNMTRDVKLTLKTASRWLKKTAPMYKVMVQEPVERVEVSVVESHYLFQVERLSAIDAMKEAIEP